jgi:NAD(P)-dependent dehydrogenase (short-subunit alcohol dehydrogenase family)
VVTGASKGIGLAVVNALTAGGARVVAGARRTSPELAKSGQVEAVEVDLASQAASQLVTGRFTQPAEVAGLVLFLAGDGAGNITGADFTIDGGLVPPW